MATMAIEAVEVEVIEEIHDLRTRVVDEGWSVVVERVVKTSWGWRHETVACQASAVLGLGECQCEAHAPWLVVPLREGAARHLMARRLAEEERTRRYRRAVDEGDELSLVALHREALAGVATPTLIRRWRERRAGRRAEMLALAAELSTRGVDPADAGCGAARS